ncbi:MAG: glycosyltransferase family 39 protein [Nanoarchaeota archaeon]
MEFREFFLKHYVKIFLFLIILLQFLQLSYWINTHDINPAFDEAWHLSNALYYQRLFSDSHIPSSELASHYPIFGYAFNYYNHPNLFYFISSLFNLEYPDILYVNIIFLILLILGVYGIGFYLFDKDVGLFAAFLISVFPLTLGLSRNYLLDLPLASILVLDIYLLLKSVYFSDKKYSLLFLLFFIIGIIFKRSFLIFILPILLYYLVKYFKNNNNKPNKKFIVLSILTFIFIINYNFWNLLEALNRLYNFSLENNLLYFNLLISELSLFIFVILLVACILCLKNQVRCKMILFMSLPILIFYLLGVWFESRYSLPYFYVFALIISKGFFSIKNNFLRRLLIIIIILISLLQFSAISYEIDMHQKFFKIGSDSFAILKKDLSGVYFSSSEKGKDRIDIPKILNIINSSVIDSSRICIIAHSTQLNDINLPFYAIYYNYNFDYMLGEGCNPLNYDFTIYKSINKKASSRIPSFLNAEKILLNNSNKFELIGNLSNSEFVYKRKAL